MIELYESSGEGNTKQLDNDTGLSAPSPAITDPAGITYLNLSNNSKIRFSVNGLRL